MMRMCTLSTWLALVAFCACSKSNDATGGNGKDSTIVPVRKGWKLVWHDEFDYKGLPDPTKWGYEEGFVRNNEEQYYTKARAENAMVDAGMLTITARKESYPNAAYQSGSTDWKKKNEFASYTSACLITRAQASWTYGRFEVKARLPKGKGVWPAIWTLGFGSWPDAGEIDIMEHVGFEPGRIHTNVHYIRTTDNKYATQMRSLTLANIVDSFHVYALEWNEKELIWFIDDVEVNRFQTDKSGQAFHKNHYLLLNLAMGGSWGGWIDASSLPQKYTIDYVRVFQKESKPNN